MQGSWDKAQNCIEQLYRNVPLSREAIGELHGHLQHHASSYMCNRNPRTLDGTVEDWLKLGGGYYKNN